MNRFRLVIALAAVIAFAWSPAVAAQPGEARAQEALRTWYRLMLELVRHTPTYSPPVASRSFAYLGVAAFEAVASGSGEMRSLAGQLNGFGPGPEREVGKVYDDAAIIQAAMAHAARNFFGNTGPTGQRAMKAVEAKLDDIVSADLPPDVAERSHAYGAAVARHIHQWSLADGGAVVVNMGFPLEYELSAGQARWVPTSLIAQQQKPLLPRWGQNRTFAMPDGASCPLPAPPAYSEDKGSDFYKEAIEVYEVSKNLSPEQRAVARFWSDDPMLSPTPPGHWISIAMQILEQQEAELGDSVDLLARLGVAMADSFIGCWQAKFQYDLLRPSTYIRRLIDPKWEALLITPPFPEYPSGHSTQSAAAASVLTKHFGDGFAFSDTTHEADGLPARAYPSFWAAAEEAGVSRLYGGIHFRAAIERGLDQGRCVGGYTNALRTRN